MAEIPRGMTAGLRAALENVMGLAPSLEVDPWGRDAELVEEVGPVLDTLYDHWFRVETRGLEVVQEEGPTILVANHAGALPWDAAMLATAVRRQGKILRPLLEDEVFLFPYLGVLVTRLGAVRACLDDAERILGEGGTIALFPEGARGPRKPYSKRYVLESFGGGGFVRLAHSMGARIVPVAILGSEETHPLLATLRLSSLRLPVTPTFPWLGPLGLVPLPTPWKIRAGVPIELEGEEMHGVEAKRRADEIRDLIQSMLNRMREDGGSAV